MDGTPTHEAGPAAAKLSPRTIALWLFTRRSGWRGAVVRVAIMAVVLLVFRYHVVTWLVAGHNGLWKVFTRADRNNPADVSRLARLRGPGARMLVRIGEARALAQVVDSAMIPALLDLAREHPDAKVRTAALMGACNFHDEDILEALAGALDDPESQVRRAAVAGFHDVGDERHIGLLVGARKKETDARVKTLIERAILRLSPAPERPSGGKVKVAAIQFASDFGAPEKNRERLAEFVRRAAREGAKVVVLPETAITGYMDRGLRTAWQLEGRKVTEGLRGRSPAAVAEPVPGPSTREFGRLA
ncbi:MAG: HEAT repeat domain-containing protein, partial [Planctomycetota bacterium]